MEDESMPLQGGNELTREDVQKRVQDWLSRLAALFDEARTWATAQKWSASDFGSMPMQEELMQKFSVPTAQQPTLRLDVPGGGYVMFKPKALWVIGANGRVDVYTRKGAYIIVDLAEQYEEPKWTMFGGANKKGGIAFNPSVLLDLV